MQTAVVKSLEHRNAPKLGEDGFRPWFYRVVHNQAIDWLRFNRKFTGDGEGKRRLWRASTESHQFEPSDFAGDEDLDRLGRDVLPRLAV